MLSLSASLVHKTYKIGSGERSANQMRTRIAIEYEHDQVHMFLYAIGDWLIFFMPQKTNQRSFKQGPTGQGIFKVLL